MAALRDVERDYVVTGAERRHARAGLDHHAGALVAEDRGEQPFGVLARERVGIGVAYAGRLDLDQHFALPGSVEIDGFDLERSAGLVCDSRPDLHENAPAIIFKIFREMPLGNSLGPARSRLLAEQDHPITNRAAAVGVEHLEGDRLAAA